MKHQSKTSLSSDITPPGASDAPAVDSRRQPPWHVAVLGLFTMSLYLGYWAFKTYRDLKREAIEVNGYPEDTAAQEAGVERPALAPIPPRKKDLHLDSHTRETLETFARTSPILRGIGVLVPLVQIYLLTTLTIGVANLMPNEQSFPRRRPLFAAAAIVGSFVVIASLARLPGAFYGLAFLLMVPIACLQHWLNQYWARVEAEDADVRYAFNVWEMLIIIVGAACVGIVATGLMMGISDR